MEESLNSDLFWSLFNPGIPLSVYASCLVIGSIGSAIILLNKTTANRHIISIWLLLVLFLMLYTTVLGREPQPYRNYHLVPLWSLDAIHEGLIETLYEKINNVLLFVPYGILLGLKGSFSAGAMKTAEPSANGSNSSKGLCFASSGLAIVSRLAFGKFKRAILVGFLTSVTIEVLQLITHTGTCETDDVICNSLGGWMGTVVSAGIIKVFKKSE